MVTVRSSMNQPCTAVISDPLARREVHTTLYDRVCIVPGRLDYALIPSDSYRRISPAAPSSLTVTEARGNEEEPDTVYVTIDDQLVYARFFADFGPLHLGQTVQFCRAMKDLVTETRKVLLISSDHPHKRANAMTLLSLYLVIVQKQTPREAIAPFRSLRPAQGFRDAACGLCSYFITVFDCACAVYKAMRTSIFDCETFRLDDYEHYDKLQYGDINWIVPGKLLAFSGPQRERVILDGNGRTTLLAHEYAKLFTTLGVGCVVRFNEPTTYDRRAFTHANIRHLDMHYPDGGNPTDEILFKFIRVCERESGAVAVHCKAGLGRTGTNIAAYLMKTYRFSASEAIAWCRICRPGSIVGPQQQFLVVKQPQLCMLGIEEDEQRRQQPSKTENTSGGPVTVKRQSFAAVWERLPKVSGGIMPVKQPLRPGGSIPSSVNLVASIASSKPTNRLR